jgi:hypothetical protein
VHEHDSIHDTVTANATVSDRLRMKLLRIFVPFSIGLPRGQNHW